MAPQVKPRLRSWIGRLGLQLLPALLTGCPSSPEEVITGCWVQTRWHYARPQEVAAVSPHWNDGVRMREYPERELVLHQAESWNFKPKGELEIEGSERSIEQARWRLKGRGHVLTIRHGEDSFEVYEIKELNSEQLILHYDMGVEVRGIAQLEFSRTACSPESRGSNSQDREPRAWGARRQ